MRWTQIISLAVQMMIFSNCNLGSLPKPKDINDTDMPPVLRKVPDPSYTISVRRQCIKKLNDNVTDVRNQMSRSDALTIVGGSIATVSGLIAAILAATSNPMNPSDSNKYGVIASATVSGAAGIVALLSKVVKNPSEILTSRTKFEPHFDAGEQALSILGLSASDATKMTTYANSEFALCNSDLQTEVAPRPTVTPIIASDGVVAGKDFYFAQNKTNFYALGNGQYCAFPTEKEYLVHCKNRPTIQHKGEWNPEGLAFIGVCVP